MTSQPILADSAIPFLYAVSHLKRSAQERELAQRTVKKHIDLAKKSTSSKATKKHIEELEEHIETLVAKEKQAAGLPMQDIGPLKQQIEDLERDLSLEREKSAKMERDYRAIIAEMKSDFSRMKSKMMELIREQRGFESVQKSLQSRR